MKIGDVARAAGVTTSRIRFYEAEGVIAPADRALNGYRDYPASTVDLIVFIERAQKLGFSLKEIRAGASAPQNASKTDGHPASCETVLPALRAKLADIETHIAAAQATREEIMALIATLEAGHAAAAIAAE